MGQWQWKKETDYAIPGMLADEMDYYVSAVELVTKTSDLQKWWLPQGRQARGNGFLSFLRSARGQNCCLCKHQPP